MEKTSGVMMIPGRQGLYVHCWRDGELDAIRSSSVIRKTSLIMARCRRGSHCAAFCFGWTFSMLRCFTGTSPSGFTNAHWTPSGSAAFDPCICFRLLPISFPVIASSDTLRVSQISACLAAPWSRLYTTWQISVTWPAFPWLPGNLIAWWFFNPPTVFLKAALSGSSNVLLLGGSALLLDAWHPIIFYQIIQVISVVKCVLISHESTLLSPSDPHASASPPWT